MYVNNKALILDGGLGTTLEERLNRTIDSPLWSTQLLRDDPEAIHYAHAAFLRAGANIISTATYQSSFESFARANMGLSQDDACEIMRKGVHIADSACALWAQTSESQAKDIRLALSLGPFGASLPGAQEFSGAYPPPYGPRISNSQPRNFFLPEERDEEEKSIAALTNFHLSRLKVFKNDRQTWSKVDFIAFETVPLAREIKAIRRAMGLLFASSWGGSADEDPRHIYPSSSAMTPNKPWWISTVWPDGIFPERRTANKGSSDSVSLDVMEVMHALYSDHSPSFPSPSGFGINCTAVRELDRLMQRVQLHPLLTDNISVPFLVLYPSGATYISETGAWERVSEDERGERVREWTEQLTTIAMRELQRNCWSGVVLGGCCKVGPDNIEAISRWRDRELAFQKLK